MRIAVTGGGGFIGRHLVQALAARGDTVVVLDNLRRGHFDGLDAADCLVASVDDADACGRVFAGADAIVHLAAQANVMGSVSSPAYTVTTNVAGTATVALAAAAAGVGHIVFASSREVYGEPLSLPVPEDAPLRPKNLYGASKAAAELLLQQLGVPASILRFANVVGPGDSDRVVPRWLHAARSAQPLELYGGAQVIDFVPVGTAVAAIIAALDRGPLDGPVNVGTGRGTTLQELAARILESIPGSTVSVLPPRGPEVSRFVADARRMVRVLGVEPPADSLRGIETWATAPA